MLVEKSFDTGEVVLNYAEGPDNGPPFVILPAYDNRWQSYKSIIPSLEARYHLYGLDARGRGKSGRTPGRYKLKHSVEDTEVFLSQIVSEPSILFGHSNGGWISLWVADTVSHLVKAVIYGDASLNIEGLIERCRTKEEMESYRKFKEWSGKPVDHLVELIKELYPERGMDFITMRAETYSQCDSEVQDYWVEGRLDEFFEGFMVKDILGRLKVPLLILQANPEMGMINHVDVGWVKSLMAELSHVFLEDADHWLGLQDGREHLFLNAVNPFLEHLK